MNDFMASSGKLSAEISAIRFEYQEILDGVKLAKMEKTEAKKQYKRNIDAGSESGLKNCLKTIRACNETIESLPALRESFFGKIAELETQHRSLMTAARENVREFEEKLAGAAKDLENAKDKSSSVKKVVSEVGGLKSLIVSSGEIRSVSEDEEI